MSNFQLGDPGMGKRIIRGIRDLTPEEKEAWKEKTKSLSPEERRREYAELTREFARQRAPLYKDQKNEARRKRGKTDRKIQAIYVELGKLLLSLFSDKATYYQQGIYDSPSEIRRISSTLALAITRYQTTLAELQTESIQI